MLNAWVQTTQPGPNQLLKQIFSGRKQMRPSSGVITVEKFCPGVISDAVMGLGEDPGYTDNNEVKSMCAVVVPSDFCNWNGAGGSIRIRVMPLYLQHYQEAKATNVLVGNICKASLDKCRKWEGTTEGRGLSASCRQAELLWLKCRPRMTSIGAGKEHCASSRWTGIATGKMF